MLTIWVKSRCTPTPRRTHRWRVGANKTECGIHAVQMQPVSTAKVGRGIIPPQFCHICFKYRYRFLSSRPKRAAREWRHLMMNIHRL